MSSLSKSSPTSSSLPLPACAKQRQRKTAIDDNCQHCPNYAKCMAIYMRHDTSGITHNMYTASTYLSVSHEQQFSDPPYGSYKVAKLAERCSRCFALELYREYCRISQFRGKADSIKSSPHLPSALRCPAALRLKGVYTSSVSMAQNMTLLVAIATCRARCLQCLLSHNNIGGLHI